MLFVNVESANRAAALIHGTLRAANDMAAGKKQHGRRQVFTHATPPGGPLGWWGEVGCRSRPQEGLTAQCLGITDS